jgi:hypothetical protein
VAGTVFTVVNVLTFLGLFQAQIPNPTTANMPRPILGIGERVPVPHLAELLRALWLVFKVLFLFRRKPAGMSPPAWGEEQRTWRLSWY